MKKVLSTVLTTSILAATGFAGHMIAPSKEVKETVEEVRTIFPDRPLGNVTIGAQFSESATGAYVDAITGLWSPKERDAFLFLNSHYHYEDNGQFIRTTGLGFRKLFPEQEVIVGANAYYDSLHSARGNDFDQLGLGVEVLTRWVDVRFNYYLPEDDIYEVDRRTEVDRHEKLSPYGRLSSVEKRHAKRYEGALEGFNAEIGFLIPGLDRYIETRIFGGYYHYDNPFGSAYEGFKARLEARLLPGVIAEVEYWQDEALMGGNWTAGVAVSVPFSIYNLVTGRNPFEGADEMFRPGPRPFASRMSDQVERSHRIQTTSSGWQPTGHTKKEKFTSLDGATVTGGLPGAPLPFPIE